MALHIVKGTDAATLNKEIMIVERVTDIDLEDNDSEERVSAARAEELLKAWKRILV